MWAFSKHNSRHPWRWGPLLSPPLILSTLQPWLPALLLGFQQLRSCRTWADPPLCGKGYRRIRFNCRAKCWRWYRKSLGSGFRILKFHLFNWLVGLPLASYLASLWDLVSLSAETGMAALILDFLKIEWETDYQVLGLVPGPQSVLNQCYLLLLSLLEGFCGREQLVRPSLA